MEPGVPPSVPQCESPRTAGPRRPRGPAEEPLAGALSQPLQCVPAGREPAFPLVGVTFRKRKLSLLIEEGLQALLRRGGHRGAHLCV